MNRCKGETAELCSSETNAPEEEDGFVFESGVPRALQPERR